MKNKHSLDLVITQVLDEGQSEREKAVALHDFVRDSVAFGFNKYFDAAPPAYTLCCGLGHCNPKSRLMVALFKEAGFECCQHFVVVPKAILQGVIPPYQYWMIPKEISHSFVEVQVEGQWYQIDSFILDTHLLESASARLAREGREMGYAVRQGSVNIWDGRGDAFSQFSEDLMIEDHGRVDDDLAFYGDKRYRNKALGLPFNTVFRLMGEMGVRPINDLIDRIRWDSGYPSS